MSYVNIKFLDDLEAAAAKTGDPALMAMAEALKARRELVAAQDRELMEMALELERRLKRSLRARLQPSPRASSQKK